MLSNPKNKDGHSDEEEESEEEEEEEPKLKYERMGNAVNEILKGEECASCMAVHAKVFGFSSYIGDDINKRFPTYILLSIMAVMAGASRSVLSVLHDHVA